ncbi:tetratricopeptide repeat protein [Actibacterium sp. 188UL27-1]|uniref:tetratricopeptide repeat protein n=1 Tax=Actibacterium sp. 188UL27-1 TaxID=2786961 RepID=UPI0019581C04|nr:tetratricopeptide repeat protein [Actibacterium sp. 188UL27-1]MBM7068984.1 tetratricopeptide repeat protein [Actibacterium sp. 188UL27-1]
MPSITPSRLLFAMLLCLGLAGCQTSEERAEGHYQRSLELIAEGDVDRALVELRNVFKLNGFHREARSLYALTVRQRGEKNEAFSQYLRLVEQHPDAWDAYLALAELSLEFNRYPDAERYLKEAQRTNSDDPGLQVVQAAVNYRNAVLEEQPGTRREVAQTAKALTEQLPDSMIARGIVINSLIRDGEEVAALEELDAALAVEDNNRAFYRIKLELLARRGEDDKVEALLRDMLGKFDNDNGIRQTLIRFYLSRGDKESAEKFLRDQIATDTSGDEERVTLVRFMEQIRGRDEARALLDELIDEGTNDQLFRSMRARMNFEDGFKQKALVELEEILDGAESNDQTRELRVLLAQMLDDTGNHVGAREVVEKVLTEDSQLVEALKVRAAWLIEDDQADQAIVDLRRALDQDPNDHTLMTLMAQAHVRNGNRELAGEVLASAVDASNNAPQTALIYTQFLLAENRLRPAEAALVNALRITPGHPELLRELGGVYVALQDWPRAEQVVRSLRRLDSEMGRRVADQLQLAVLTAQDREEEVFSFLDELSQEDGGNLGADLGVLHLHLRNGDTDVAAAHIETLMVTRPDDRGLRFLRSVVWGLQGEADKAIEGYRTLLAENSDAERIWIELVRALNAQGQSDEALTTLREGIEATTASPNLQWMLASSLEQSGDQEGALEIYEALYDQNTATSVIANNLASLLSTLRDDPESLDRAYRVARRLRDSDFAPFQDTYGWISYLRGDYEEALRHLEPAAEGLPQDPTVQYHLAKVYIALNQPAKAKPLLEQALDLAGDDPRAAFEDAREQLDRLGSAETAPTTPSE